jgi:hypothetical protein
MDRNQISARLIEYVLKDGAGLPMKISAPDDSAYISFTIKHSSFSDKELASALSETSGEIIHHFPWVDREMVGWALVNKNLSLFHPALRKVVDVNYESLISSEHVMFGFGNSNSAMMFKMHSSLLYNTIVNSITAT